jgi:hypothetical protein
MMAFLKWIFPKVLFLAWYLRSFCVSAEIILEVIAGTGSNGVTNGDGGVATLTVLRAPLGIFASSSGNVFIADLEAAFVRHIDTNGIIHNLVGTGSKGYTMTGGAGTELPLLNAWGVVGDTTGQFLYISTFRHIWKYDISSGIAERYAGGSMEVPTDFGDGGPANTDSANILDPSNLWLTTDGILYFGTDNCNVRKVAADGILSRVAGSDASAIGICGDSGDGELALSSNVKLYHIRSVYMDTSGVLFICDTFNHRLRYVDTADILNTYAGGGDSFEDGLDATSVVLSFPYDVKGDRFGNLYLAESMGRKILKIDSNRKIYTYIGNGHLPLSPIMPIAALTDSISGVYAMSYDEVNDILYFCESGSFIVKRTIEISPASSPSSESSSLPPAIPSVCPM